MKQEQITALVAQLTLEEKAGLCSGQDNWFTKAVERLAIPACRTSDGPNGLRTQEGTTNSLAQEASLPAVCFPTGCSSAASFDRALIHKMGAALGRECQALGVNVLLGPGVNIKRSPLCGRNFEYFSEDPLLSGELGAAYVNGVQSEGAGTSLKHFFANSQEHRRTDISSEVDERTLREIYLTAFEIVVKKAQPWTIMAAYNRINGTYATAHTQYLTHVLRDEWGFEGLVMSDWGATHNRVAAVEAGCDLTMPAENTDSELVLAVQEGRLAEKVLDSCCERVLALAFKGAEGHKSGIAFDYEGDHALAREVAANAIVLLKNDDAILPLNKAKEVAFIGDFAKTPHFQGGGSSNINSFRVASAHAAALGAGLPVFFSQGYDNTSGNTTDTLLAQAVAAAKAADVAVVFAGLSSRMESEGVDRRHMQMPEGHNKLIEAVCAANANTVVVLHNGAPVEMPWAEKPKAILEAYLGGQAVGEAVVDVLYGDVNPSGHLPESFPQKLADNPSHLFYFGQGNMVQYSEQMFVGYRYYESKEMEVLFPFGHGLSYTTFAYSGLALDKTKMNEAEELTVHVTVTNTKKVAGKALVQLYIAPKKGEVIRPVRELKSFEKIALAPGESKTVSFTLGQRAFAYWNTDMHSWCVEGGAYAVQIGESAHCMVAEEIVELTSKDVVPVGGYSNMSPMAEIVKHPLGKKFVDENIGYMLTGMAAAGFIPKELLSALPLGENGTITLAMIETIAQHAGATAGGASGIGVLLSQAVSMLTNFAPPEKTDELKQVLAQMNEAE